MAEGWGQLLSLWLTAHGLETVLGGGWDLWLMLYLLHVAPLTLLVSLGTAALPEKTPHLISKTVEDPKIDRRRRDRQGQIFLAVLRKRK